MITTWYFCSCVDAGPKVTQAYLSTIETLRFERSQPALVLQALHELTRAEPAMLHYAVPDLIATGLRPAAQRRDVAEAYRRVLRDAWGGLTADLGNRLLTAWEALRANRGTSTESLVRPLREALTRAFEPQEHAEPEAVPYCGDFLAQSTVLCLCVQAVRRHPELADNLARDDDVVRQVRRAIAGEFGRQAMLLAAEAATLLGDEVIDAATVRRKLMEAPGTAARWEPDVLAATARVLFGYPEDVARGDNAATLRQQVLEETVTFWSLGRSSAPGADRVAQAAVDRLGLVGTPDEPTSAVLWQAVLWELAALIDPVGTVEQLRADWIAPHKPIAQAVRVALPLPKGAYPAWLERASGIATLRAEGDQVITFELGPGMLRRHSYLAVALLSPWITHRKPSGGPEPAYPRARDGLALLRLLMATATAYTLLRAPVRAGRDHLVALALHAGDVLADSGHDEYLNMLWYGGAPADETMTAPVSGLALHVRRLIRLLGTGSLPEVDPAWFAEYLRDAAEEGVPLQERWLRKTPALRVALPWIEDALSGSWKGSTTPLSRWRQAPKEAGFGYAQLMLRDMSDRFPFGEFAKPAALLKAHFGEQSKRAERQSWHRGTKRAKPDRWKALAAARLTADEWAVVPRHDLPRAPSARLAVLSAQLLDVLADGAGDRPEFAGAIGEWVTSIGRVTDKTSLPRALRMFLLGLLSSPLTGTAVEHRVCETLIDVEVELGFGTPLDRWRLFQQLGTGSALKPEFAQELRLRMLRAVYGWAGAATHETQIRDPWAAYEDALSNRLLDHLLERFLFDLGGHTTDWSPTPIAALALQQWQATQTPPDLRELPIDLDGATPATVRTAVGDPRLVVGAVIDPVADVARLHLLRETDRHGIEDGFCMQEEELAAKVKKPSPTPLLGVVAAAEQRRVWVNVGLRRPIAADVAHDAQVGDLVVVQAQNTLSGPVAVPGEHAEARATLPVEGDLRRASVTVKMRDDGTPDVEIKVEGETAFVLGRHGQGERYRRLWAPDVARLMTGEQIPDGAKSWTSETLARRDGQCWLPVDQRLAEFLAVTGSSGEVRRMVVVDVLDEDTARYSTAPGANVVVPHSAWHRDSKATVELTLRRAGGEATGLALDVRVVGNADGDPALCIAYPDGASSTPDPFDHRAQKWRALFRNDDDYEALWNDDRGGFEAVDVHVEGFPRVEVDLNEKGQRRRFTVSRWGPAEQWGARVVGEAVEERELKLPEDGSPEERYAAFDSVMNVREGDVLTLSNTAGVPRFGMLRAWTDLNLPVEVEPESLCFKALGRKGDLPSELVRGRKVEVCADPKPRPQREPQEPRAISDADLLQMVPADDRAAAEDSLIHTRVLRGIVTATPRESMRDVDVITVTLDMGAAVRCDLVRANFDTAAIVIGDDVTATRNRRGRWEFHPRGRRIQVRARWRLVEGRPDPKEGRLALGTVIRGGARRALTQSLRRPTLYVHSVGHAEPQYLAERGPRTNKPGITWKNPTAVEPTWSYSDQCPRVVVRLLAGDDEVAEDAPMLSGVVARASNEQDVAVTGVEMELTHVTSTEVVAFRVFALTRSSATADDQGSDEVDGYRTYMAGDRGPLLATLEKGRVKLKVPWSVPDAPEKGRVWLTAGETPWVDAQYAPTDVRVVLEEHDGHVTASYRHVPPAGLEEAVALLRRQGMVPNVRSRLRQPLRYAGRYETPSGWAHRFEWGYGYTLTVPEARLTVAGKEKWPVTPFHGDEIHEVTIRQRSKRAPTMDISLAGLVPGWRSDLFKDSVNGLVALADIQAEPDGSGPRIVALHTRWRRPPATGDERYHDDHPVPERQRVAAALHPDTVRAVREAWAAEKTEDRGARTAFVRLHLDDFQKYGGNLLRFTFVRPVLGGPNGLALKSYVFLEVQRILDLTNDVRLQLKPSRMLGAGPGNPFTVDVTRRDFSARENLLRQICRGDGSGDAGSRLRGDVYLVQLTKFERGARSAAGRIRAGLSRSVGVLRSFLAETSKLGVVEPGWERGTYDLELRPNVTFHLRADDIEVDHPLPKGTIVRVRLTGGRRIRLEPALLGDDGYVSAQGRPAVLLPMENLLKPRHGLDKAVASGHYSVAGLPSVVVSGAGDAPPGSATRSFATRLITQRHPKIAKLVAVRGQGWTGYRFAAPDAADRAGTVTPCPDGTVEARDVDDAVRRIRWAAVSFLDAGRQEIEERCRTAWWTYHDTSTRRRDPQPPHAPLEDKDDLPQRAMVTEEVVFFEPDWSLRHPPDRMRRFGFPAGELVEGGLGRGKAAQRKYPVAGVAAMDGRATGLWIEVAPGRVLEAPGSIMTTADAARTSLDAIDWSHFAPGDVVELAVQRGHRLEPGSLALRRWAPGPRGGLGARALLPVAAFDAERGAATLGAGAVTLRYPTEPDRPLAEGGLVWLTDRNELTHAVDVGAEVREGDVVLVAVAGDRLSVLGAPDLECVVDAAADGWADWVRDALCDGRAAALAELNGGCLPMTVEGVTDGRVAVSRRHQRDGALAAGCVVPGVPLGVFGADVVFRAGSRFHRSPLRVVLPCLPPRLADQALERLRRTPEMLWLHGWRDDAVAVGLSAGANASGETRVRLVEVVGDDDVAGVLTWQVDARRPRWLPARETGWTLPDRAALAAWVATPPAGRPARGWPANRREVPVAVRGDGSVSVVGTAANRQRLRQLKVGDVIRVEVVGDATGTPTDDGRLSFPAQVYLSEVFVELRLDETAPPFVAGTPRRCEVEVKRTDAGRTRVGACDAGMRRVRMALPARFVDDLDEGVARSGHLPVVLAADQLTEQAGDLPPDSRETVAAWLDTHGEGLFGLRPDTELGLVPALSAVAVLAALGVDDGECAKAAVHGLRQLGLRAAVSRHVEPLARLLPAVDDRANSNPLWNRLGDLSRRTRAGTDDVGRIRNVDAAVRSRTALRPDDDLALASACMAAAVGAHADYDQIAEETTVLGRLAAIGRSLAPRATELTAQDALLPVQIAMLLKLRRQALVNLDITLLAVPEPLQDPSCARARSTLNLLREAPVTAGR